MAYSSLHCHTARGSNMRLLDSIVRISELVDKAIEYGYNAVAITDHEVLSAHIEALKVRDKIQEKHPDFKIILGNEIYLIDESEYKHPPKFFHFILWACDAIGYQQLKELSSRAWGRSYKQGKMYRSPTFYRDVEEIVKPNQGHIMAATACFTKGHQVLTQNGNKNIEDIQAGDIVLTKGGTWEQVIEPTHREYQGAGNILTFKYCPSITCTANHKFLVYTPYQRPYVYNGKLRSKEQIANIDWKEAQDLKKGDLCLSPFPAYNYSQKDCIDISYILEDFNKQKSIHNTIAYKQQINKTIQLTPILCRTLGLWLGDGYVSKTTSKVQRVGWSFNEKEFSHFFPFVKEGMQQFGDIHWIISHHPEQHKVEAYISSQKLACLFRKLFGEVDSYTKNIPSWLLHISQDLDAELLYGFALADGSYREKTDKYGHQWTETNLTTVSPQLRDHIIELCYSVGFIPRLCARKAYITNGVNHVEAYYIYISSALFDRNCNKFSIIPHHELMSHFVKQLPKHQKGKMVIYEGHKYLYASVRSNQEIDIQETVYCLRVQNDHSFVCNGVFVHNCPGGELGYCIENHEQERLNRFVPWCIETFGKENFFFEMQDSNAPNQQVINQTIIRLSEFFDIPYIVTSDVHYLNEEDQAIHAAFLNSKEEKERETEAFYKYTYLKPENTMKKILSYLPEEVVQKAMDNTQIIYNRIENFDIRHSVIVPQVKIYNPDFVINAILVEAKDYPYIQKFVYSEYDQDRYLMYNIGVGITEKFPKAKQPMEVWLDRINTELEVVWNISEYHHQRISAYFNLVKRIVDTIWEVTLVMCGRGSAPGFLTNYLIGNTQFNPLDYNLPYWRFLNNERLDDFPDIDIDIDPTKTDEALALLRKEFGDGCVLNTLTFHTESLKSAILTACRGTGISSDEAQVLSSMIPVERGKVASLAECLGEVDGTPPVPGFKEALERYGILDIVREIEGLESGAGVHASSVYIFDKGYLDHNSLMKSATGDAITAFNMHDSDSMGALKFDLLKTDATTKITKCLQLLLNDGLIEWQGSLRATYDKYIHPDRIDFNDPKIWDAIDAGQIQNLFQFESQVGAVAIQRVQPRTILEVSLCNDGMRLQGTLHGLSPIERFAAFKKDVSLWYTEMQQCGLTAEEVKVLEPYALPTYGNSINQEMLMRILMDKHISGFTLREANNARKVLAKKLTHKVAELKQQYYDKAEACGTRKIMAEYVYVHFIEPQLGYSFSTIHSHAYSIIGVQEAQLYTHYNSLYWNCACLSVNAGSADTDFEDYGDEEAPEDVLEAYELEALQNPAKKAAVTNYGKIAKAIGDIQNRGIKVDLPDINRAQSDFVPDTKTNSIIYGMQAISSVNADTITQIIANRPYTSLLDFCQRTPLTNLQMISLIKSGAFDAIEGKSRLYIMDQYLLYAAKQKIQPKAKLTMANYDKALELNIIPDSFTYEVKMTYFKKWIDKNCIQLGVDGKTKYYILTDNDELKFFDTLVINSLTRGKDYDIIPNGYSVKVNAFKKFYDGYIASLKNWMLTAEAIDAMYQGELNKQITEWKEKYCQGSISKWEMDSMSYYYSAHELAKITPSVYNVANFNTLPEQPKVVGYKKNARTGVEYPQYEMKRIMGTVLNADKTKHIVTLLTCYGVVDVKFYKMAFINYNKRITKVDDKGKKTVIEGSWFTRGNLLLINGLRKENMFSPRRDFSPGGFNTSVSLITGIKNNNILELKHQREKV